MIRPKQRSYCLYFILGKPAEYSVLVSPFVAMSQSISCLTLSRRPQLSNTKQFVHVNRLISLCMSTPQLRLNEYCEAVIAVAC